MRRSGFFAALALLVSLTVLPSVSVAQNAPITALTAPPSPENPAPAETASAVPSPDAATTTVTTTTVPAMAGPAGGPQPVAPSADGVVDYILGVGDKLKVTVFGETGLSSEYQISSTGMISMSLIGDVKAGGLTVPQVQAAITQKLSDGYMKNPNVSVEVLNYRPFFILGEVMKPGSYNYVNGMSVVNAVALAGGYTYRADKDGITIKHGTAEAQPTRASETQVVMPGDVVNVPERFF